MLANEFTEECLQKLSKRLLIAMVLSQWDKTKATIESLRDEVKKMNSNFKKLGADVSIVKTVNNLLIKKSVDIERQCWANSQYSRIECLEIAGIPTSIPQQSLEEKISKIFEAIGVSVDKNDIDDCHKLRDKERTIVKFLRRNDYKQVLRCKKDLRSINMSNLDLPEGTKLSITESLCPYYKSLWVMCKKLWNRKQIHSFFNANGIMKFCFQEHSPVNVITHQQDLKDLFPDFDIDAL